jgi:hypothetical protein
MTKTKSFKDLINKNPSSMIDVEFLISESIEKLMPSKDGQMIKKILLSSYGLNLKLKNGILELIKKKINLNIKSPLFYSR